MALPPEIRPWGPPVYSFDPGLNECGIARWTPAGTLVFAWLVRTRLKPSARIEDRWRDMVYQIGEGQASEIVFELPKVYKMSPGDPNDLINLALIDGAIMQKFIGARVTKYLPSEWKRNLDKPVIHSLIRSGVSKLCPRNLSEEEVGRMDLRPKSLAHNVLDAVAIGMHHFGRLTLPKRGRARNT